MMTASVLALALGQAAVATPEIDPETGLRIGPGWRTVAAHCGVCHSLNLVTAQRADRATWLDMIRWMQETQNLWRFDEATENLILDYLARAYPPARNDRRPPLPRSLLPPPQP
jgi:hypothetical protein